MEQRARVQFLSAVVLVVVFAAGGLVGAALSRPASGTSAGPVSLSEPSDTSASVEEAEASEEREGPVYMFERAGATEEQSRLIRSEIVPWYREAWRALHEDSTVRELESRMDSLRAEYREVRRDLRDYEEPRERALTDSARALIRAVLDPQAQLAYDSIVAESNRENRDDDGDRRRP